MTAQLVTALHDQLRNCRSASLGSLLGDGGYPYVSLVNFAIDAAGFPILFLSNLAWHTQNLQRDGRASLLLAELPKAGDALMGARMTIVGTFETLTGSGNRDYYLQRHPEAKDYIDFADFGFWRMTPTLVHVVAGFGRIQTYGAAEVFPLAS